MSNPTTASGPMFPLGDVIRENLGALREHWLRFVILGVLLLVLGIVALGYAVTASVVTALVVGYFLIFSGAIQVITSFFTGRWGGFFLGLLAGVLHFAIGFLIVNHPAETLIIYTLLVAALFFVEGLFRIFAALAGRFQNWGLLLLSGIVTLLLGVAIWMQWPFSGLYLVGILIGVNLIVSGAVYIAVGLTARRLRA